MNEFEQLYQKCLARNFIPMCFEVIDVFTQTGDKHGITLKAIGEDFSLDLYNDESFSVSNWKEG